MRRRLRRPLSFLVHRHVGTPAVVIGGGVSRSSQLAQCPPPGEAVYVSANGHGCELAPCDYIVCLDLIEKELRAFGVPLVTPRNFGDIRIFEKRMHQSGMMGAYLAWVMGCSPIFLCGMDCWVGGTYESDRAAKSSGTRILLSNHLDRWREVRAILAGADVRVFGGPLLEAGIFPLHDPAIPAASPAEPAPLYRSVGGLLVEFLREGKFAPYFYPKGAIAEVSENEARTLRGAREVRIIGDVREDHTLRLAAWPARRRA